MLSDAQALFLARHLGITPDSAQGIVWDAENQTLVGHGKANALFTIWRQPQGKKDRGKKAIFMLVENYL